MSEQAKKSDIDWINDMRIIRARQKFEGETFTAMQIARLTNTYPGTPCLDWHIVSNYLDLAYRNGCLELVGHDDSGMCIWREKKEARNASDSES